MSKRRPYHAGGRIDKAKLEIHGSIKDIRLAATPTTNEDRQGRLTLAVCALYRAILILSEITVAPEDDQTP